MKRMKYVIVIIVTLAIPSCRFDLPVDDNTGTDGQDALAAYSLDDYPVNMREALDYAALMCIQQWDDNGSTFLPADSTTVIPYPDKADPLFFIVNYKRSDYWEILSGDKRTTPVLAFGDGNLDLANIGTNVSAWMRSMAGDIKNLRSYDGAVKYALQNLEWWEALQFAVDSTTSEGSMIFDPISYYETASTRSSDEMLIYQETVLTCDSVQLKLPGSWARTGVTMGQVRRSYRNGIEFCQVIPQPLVNSTVPLAVAGVMAVNSLGLEDGQTNEQMLSALNSDNLESLQKSMSDIYCVSSSRMVFGKDNIDPYDEIKYALSRNTPVIVMPGSDPSAAFVIDAYEAYMDVAYLSLEHYLLDSKPVESRLNLCAKYIITGYYTAYFGIKWCDGSAFDNTYFADPSPWYIPAKDSSGREALLFHQTN